MFTVYKKQVEWGGRELTIETGRIARQADGAVTVTYGDTVVMAAVCFAKEQKEGMDFFPLTVNYQEKFYAAGRIPGGFFKREGRPTEKETLTCRLIDRPVRPLFPKQFKNETQVTVTVLSSDGVNDPDIPAMVASSAALTLSGAPFMGPIAAARVGYMDGKYVLNPTNEQREHSELDLVVAGTNEGVLMVESEASQLSEEVMLDAVMFGHDESKKVIDAIIELAEVAAKPGFEMPEVEDTSDLESKLEKKFGKAIRDAYGITEKQERVSTLGDIRTQAIEEFGGEEGENADKVKGVIKSLESSVLRKDVLKSKKRIDGRTPVDVRPILSEVDVLPRAHGSALFTRGETQALVVATLGTGRDEQIIDAIEGEYKDRFMLHYNFPPYSVGECGRVGFTSRREIGHGRLARRAIERLLPTAEDFPYTMRVVSEITESNGSSSMATVCGTSLSLMAAGVPLAKPIAGIAMGLVKEDKDYVVLSDIMGDEDHLGDMDFKVAGTEDGLTALQMDIKITSITKEIMQEALAQAKDGRLHILEKMNKALAESREEISEFAPQMKSFQIDKEKIRDVIGSGGKIIRELIEQTGCTIDIEDDGTVSVASNDREALQDCIQRIEDIVAEPEVGKIYDGTVVSTVDFGAFVKFMPNQEGLLHISEIAPVRLGQVTDVLKEGDEIAVKVVDFERGKVRLSIKEIPQDGVVAERLEEVIASGGTSSNGDGDKKGNRDRGDRKGGRGKPRRRSA